MNAADHGFKVLAFNRTVAKVDRFLDNEAEGEDHSWLFQSLNSSLLTRVRQEHCRRSLNRRVCVKAEEAEENDASSYGRKAG